MEQKSLSEFEDRIDYHFADSSLLAEALTHSSYANEKKMPKYKCNERLEFLGDAVLELIASEVIFQENPKNPEGDLSKIRASYVCEPTLAQCAKKICLGDFIRLGKGEALTGGASRDSILSDALEATIGAVYLDGGFACAQDYVERFVLDGIEKKKLFYDSKTYLQEIVQKKKGTLTYELIREEGPDHEKSFLVGVSVDGKQLATASGRTKKKAEQAAAYEAILLLEPSHKETE